MTESVDVNFRMDAQLKQNVEEICQDMGTNLNTLLTVFCQKVVQEQCIPFDVTENDGLDPFFSKSNIRYLKEKLDAYNAGKLHLEEHDLIEVD